MNIEELTSWFMKEFWPKYTHFLKVPDEHTQYGPGGRGKALKKILTLKPSKELREKILFELDAQIRHRRTLCDKLGLEGYLKHTGPLAKKGCGDVYKNRQGLTWLNQMGWMDDIPEMEIIEQRSKARLCACGAETMPGHHQCEKCYQNAGLRLVK